MTNAQKLEQFSKKLGKMIEDLEFDRKFELEYYECFEMCLNAFSELLKIAGENIFPNKYYMKTTVLLDELIYSQPQNILPYLTGLIEIAKNKRDMLKIISSRGNWIYLSVSYSKIMAHMNPLFLDALVKITSINIYQDYYELQADCTNFLIANIVFNPAIKPCRKCFNYCREVLIELGAIAQKQKPEIRQCTMNAQKWLKSVMRLNAELVLPYALGLRIIANKKPALFERIITGQIGPFLGGELQMQRYRDWLAARKEKARFAGSGHNETERFTHGDNDIFPNMPQEKKARKK